MKLPTLDAGSFRDPGGQVFISNDTVYRTVNQSKVDMYEASKKKGIYENLINKGFLLPLKERTLSDFSNLHHDVRYILEHPKLPFISYPYEWCFSAHKAAALHHLDLNIELMNSDFTLCDATAYNVQFQGTKPVFIDHLSIEPYQRGSIWLGHRQFCMQFLNPLLMWSHLGISPNAWFRGSLDGISVEDMANLLPISKKFSWTVFSNVVLQAYFQQKSQNGSATGPNKKPQKLGKQSHLGILSGLQRYIQNLKGPHSNTVWANYEAKNTYSDADTKMKRDYVDQMIKSVNPSLVYDLGCNTGNYSDVALDAGADNVVGFDFDYATLDLAYDRFNQKKKNFLPIWLDAANPSPSQGWAQAERMGLTERGPANALIALAFIHHIVIARNVPMQMAIDWLINLAPVGIIEFPNKEDPMVKVLLSHREDIFPDYHEGAFLSILEKSARIISSQRLNENGRLLVWYDAR